MHPICWQFQQTNCWSSLLASVKYRWVISWNGSVDPIPSTTSPLSVNPPIPTFYHSLLSSKRVWSWMMSSRSARSDPCGTNGDCSWIRCADSMYQYRRDRHQLSPNPVCFTMAASVLTHLLVIMQKEMPWVKFSQGTSETLFLLRRWLLSLWEGTSRDAFGPGTGPSILKRLWSLACHFGRRDFLGHIRSFPVL